MKEQHKHTRPESLNLNGIRSWKPRQMQHVKSFYSFRVRSFPSHILEQTRHTLRFSSCMDAGSERGSGDSCPLT